MTWSPVVSPIEVLPAGGEGRRRDWTVEEKVRIVEESLQGFRQGCATARRYGLSRALLTRWRKEYRNGVLVAPARQGFVPVSVLSEAVESFPPAPAPGSGPDMRIEIALANGRRVTIPATLDPSLLARLLPVLDAS
ncbi:IS66-like element accessory protein TnpA [Phyllobacterium leguminum]|uniref:Transposase-like protein n=1 Tax=Phyllobacterium leguminum TaxID=314237 RepID=A0A318T708_9HYPH|nr:transposase [Phyllobacterium leguminum]PYE84188.1 transposase-like protein [Phyllobacterium leguminum]